MSAPAQPEHLSDLEQLLICKSISLLSSGLEPTKAVRETLHLLSELLGLKRTGWWWVTNYC